VSTVKLVGSLVGTLGSGLLLSKVISKAWVISSTSSSGNETEFSSPEN